LSAGGVPNGSYYLRVRAVGEAGVSAPSAETLLTVGCAAPVPPSALSGVVNGTTVSLAWQASPTSGVAYAVIAGSTSGASNIAHVQVGGATSLTASAVPMGRYFIRVRAVTACGSADSNEVELAVGLPPLPGAPGTLTFQVAAGTVSLAWQASAGAVDGYVVEAGSQPGLSNLAVISIGNVLAFGAPGVPPGVYYVRVRGFNAAGQGPASNEVVVGVP
jgi:predicted phage tail protein